jgi:hypothetical protein
MQGELTLWLVAGVSTGVGGGLYLWQEWRGGRGQTGESPPRWLRVLAYLGLAGLLAGLGWRFWQTGAWPGSSPSDALITTAAGALLLLAWQPRRDYTASALASGIISLLIFGAAARDGLSPPPFPSPEAWAWLFGLRSILTGIGLGGWPIAFADSFLRRLRESRNLNGTVAPERISPNILRLSYPWLTAAWLAGGIWNLAAYAAPWRGVPAEVWLMINWIIGGIYLVEGSHFRAIWPALSGISGFLTALLAAWQAPTLFQ